MIDEKLKQRYISAIKPRLSEKRFYHSLCVADKSAELAKKYGANVEKAYTAGILHDIMKDTDKNRQLEIIAVAGIELSDIEKSSFKLLHAISGSIFIQTEPGVTDPDIVSAIRYHTTGRGNMTLLEKILYLADFVSEDRSFEGVTELRKAAMENLETAMLVCTEFTINELVSQRMPVHPASIDAYNDCALAALHE